MQWSLQNFHFCSAQMILIDEIPGWPAINTCHFWGLCGTSLQFPTLLTVEYSSGYLLFPSYSTMIEYACINTQKSRASIREKLHHCQTQKHGVSFQSSQKINPMLITSFICIKWKFFITQPVYSLTMEVFTEVFTCSKVINAFKQYNSWTNLSWK